VTASFELPRASQPLAAFPAFLRDFGFATAIEQTITFMAAVSVLGPRSLADIRRAAHATLAPPAERRGEFDALFDAFFVGGARPAPVAGESDDNAAVRDDRSPGLEPPDAIRERSSGLTATAAESLGQRSFAARETDRQLVRFARRAPAMLPRRRAFRWAAARSGEAFDLRRTLRQALRSEGDAPRLIETRRKTRQRRVLLLIDISGSMKTHTQAYLRFAHATTQAADRVETFTFATRLTRISRMLRSRDCARALARAEQEVDDWDGGTRIGEALGAFLAVPRFAGYARGALVVVLSDGLERGDASAMVEAVRRLARLAWRLAWLTPLAFDPQFRPQTQALQAILPLIDDFGDAGSIESLCAYVLAAASADERFSAAQWIEHRTK
jgi:uncharacterized protein